MNSDTERNQLLSTKGCVETLLSKIKEFQLRLDALRQSREINSGASRVLEEALSSTFVVATSLRANLSPFWSTTQSSEELHEAVTQVTNNAEAAESCSRCGRNVKAEFKLCPYCGFDLKPKGCLGCGQELLAEFRFCPHCGKRSEKALTPGPAEVHPEVRDLR